MAVDWEQRADFDRLRRERLTRAKEHLAESELGALLCFDMSNIRYITATTWDHEAWPGGLQGFGGAHEGVVGSQGLNRWMDVAMSRWLGRRMKPIPVT